MQERIYKWDNLKYLMMLCVVIGHSVYYFVGNSSSAKAVYLFIYTFHMPVFIFVSGMFAKNAIQKRRVDRVVEFFVIYVFIKLLETISKYMSSGNIKFHFFWEDGPAWYAFAIAVFLAVTMLIQDCDQKWVLAAAVLIGCAAGLDSHFGDHFVSMRICVFYPVFLSGYYLRSQILNLPKESKSLTRLLQVISAFVLALLLLVSYRFIDKLYPFIKLLKGKYAYDDMQLGCGLSIVLLRFLCYIFWACMIFMLICLCSKRKGLFSWLGERSMSIFIWHNFFLVLIFDVFKGKTFLLEHAPRLYLVSAICIAFIVSVFTAYLPQLRLPAKRKENP